MFEASLGRLDGQRGQRSRCLLAAGSRVAGIDNVADARGASASAVSGQASTVARPGRAPRDIGCRTRGASIRWRWDAVVYLEAGVSRVLLGCGNSSGRSEAGKRSDC